MNKYDHYRREAADARALSKNAHGWLTLIQRSPIPVGNMATAESEQERQTPMAPLSENPDCDFSAGYGKTRLVDLRDWRSEPPLPLEDLFNDPAVGQRVGKLISKAIQPDFVSAW